MTYSIALLSIPAALFWELVEALEELGIDRTYLTQVPGHPLPTTAIDMSEIGLVINRDDDRDVLVSSIDIVDLIDMVSKDAFTKGFEASRAIEKGPDEAYQTLEEAWQEYTPATEVRDKLNSFYKEHEK